MRILDINVNKVNNFYKENVKSTYKKDSSYKNDSIEISKAGKSLSSFPIDERYSVSDKRVQSIKDQVKSGTYSVDSKLVAQKILEIAKGREV